MIVSQSGSNYNVSVNDNSYDPDYEYKDSNKGIVEHEWKYKETTAANWNNGKPSTLASGKDYIVQLRVKDKQGAWSIPEVKYITTANVRVPPVATFNFSPNPVSKYETLNVNDNSYDPADKAITAREWKVYKGGSQVYSGSTPLTNFRNYDEGDDYVVSLRVRNSSNDWSEVYSRGLRVTGDTVAPSAIITPTSADATKNNVAVNVKYSDLGGSGFKHQRYAITSSPNPPSSGWSSWSNSENVNITVSQEGRMYLHLEALDNANNKFTRTAGEYLIDKTPPTLNIREESTGISHEDTTMIVSATDNLSGIKQIRYLDVDGNRGVVINNRLKVRKNGIYTFFAEDIAGNISEKTYEVNSLDKTLSFVSPTIDNFASIEIPEVITKVNTKVGKMTIKDWRDGDNSWRMQVSATPLKGDRNTLTPGVLALNINSIVKTEGEGQLPTNNMSRKTPIDNDTVNMLTASNSRGVYEVNFGDLELTVDNSEIMVGRYSTTITWEIVQGP